MTKRPYYNAVEVRPELLVSVPGLPQISGCVPSLRNFLVAPLVSRRLDYSKRLI
jgi:hypothetical protein